VSREGTAQLQIITQPEQQHRARYQTEGSRGAVKDRSGNGFPVVKLNGYNKPTTLQVRFVKSSPSNYKFFLFF
jgi:nuclear factor of activated T-cells 5